MSLSCITIKLLVLVNEPASWTTAGAAKVIFSYSQCTRGVRRMSLLTGNQQASCCDSLIIASPGVSNMHERYE
ncbi:hypothetical protein HYPSUDRAFT_999132 [Hypholoma sublateritium FD-334 SS-4]|uniref:Secreted protein n=1 Tax=Hypholoma sublateritium (strain FD-334 SS-4) TaxID=945553 RepID=A0A0D2M3U3_HYPSF|nr:hypothetical protein HYPSUDRAFT_999132 [Hypholoma sublateritium FD-334 SS-4]